MDPLTGYKDHRLDAKNRVVVPVAFAHRIRAESEGRLYLVPSASARCLEAYPAEVFHARAAAHVPDRFAGDPMAHRLFYQLAEPVELRGPGRITLPDRFLTYFPERVVRVAGMHSYLELWDPATWEAAMAKAWSALGGTGDGAPGPGPA